MGLEGEKGEQGEIGPEGPQGPIGIKGIIGKNGDLGERGDRGPTGAPGIKGDSGPRGKNKQCIDFELKSYNRIPLYPYIWMKGFDFSNFSKPIRIVVSLLQKLKPNS